MLPKGKKSNWRKREMRRLKESTPKDYKASEEAAFPGVSMKDKVFSVKKRGRRRIAGPSARSAGSDEVSAKPKETPEAHADECQMAGNENNEQKNGSSESQMGAKGKGKQRIECQESQTASPTTKPTPTTGAPDATPVTGTKRKMTREVLVEAPQASRSAQWASPDTLGLGTRVVTVSVGSVREFTEFVKRQNPRVTVHGNTESSQRVMELIGQLDELGIRTGPPEWDVPKDKQNEKGEEGG